MHDAAVVILTSVVLLKVGTKAVPQASGQTWILSPGPGFQFIANGQTPVLMAVGVDTAAVGHDLIPFPDVAVI
jgi:hypothetical protein